jgi:hypothetical protein
MEHYAATVHWPTFAGLISCECAHVGALDAMLDDPLGVDLVVVGSADGMQARPSWKRWRRKSVSVLSSSLSAVLSWSAARRSGPDLALDATQA